MKKPAPLLRLNPEEAGELHQRHTKTTADLAAVTRYHREFNKQLRALIGNDALCKLHNATENALLLADLVKEAA